MTYQTDAAGDVYAWETGDGEVEEVDPDDWGWAGPDHQLPEERRSTIEELAVLPGFAVTVAQGPIAMPGPRRRGLTWMDWPDGAAPPACYESGLGATGHFSRLSEVLGYVAVSLPANPDSSPYVVHDLVQGRRIEVGYTPPPVTPGGDGIVYVLDDGHALKFGHTTVPPAVRIRGLQTGNPRLIRTVATIGPATPAVEAHLHQRLLDWWVRGEWYQRQPIVTEASTAGGWENYLRELLPHATWEIVVHADPTVTSGGPG